MNGNTRGKLTENGRRNSTAQSEPRNPRVLQHSTTAGSSGALARLQEQVQLSEGGKRLLVIDWKRYLWRCSKSERKQAASDKKADGNWHFTALALTQCCKHRDRDRPTLLHSAARCEIALRKSTGVRSAARNSSAVCANFLGHLT